MTGTKAQEWFASPLRAQMVDLRKRTLRLSINGAAELAGVSAQTLAAYGRGDRVPPAPTLAQIFARYGHDLVAVPAGTPASLQEAAVDAARLLRDVADRLDRPAQLRAVAA
ncbi:helix-turn-helix transcriptional regulator [Dactylosporangium salmoneum]|uniref:HTH cro/C1-type domain-containing protein n=1 Tax=Dactylosporangium salmoneum TaxID=53361 RepID=A0ABP5T6J0_9ACTN